MLKNITKDVVDLYLRTGNLEVLRHAMTKRIVKKGMEVPVICPETDKEREIVRYMDLIHNKLRIDAMLKAYCNGAFREGGQEYADARNLYECRALYHKYSMDRTWKWTLSYTTKGKIRRWIDYYDPAHSVTYYTCKINGIVASMRADPDYYADMKPEDYPWEKTRKDTKQIFHTIRFYLKESMVKLMGRPGLDDEFIFKITAERIEKCVLRLFHSSGITRASVQIMRNEYNPKLYDVVMTTNLGRYTTICEG